MAEPKGWLKLHRSIMTSSVFSNSKLLKFWIWILCKAFTVPSKVTVGLQEVDVDKGQFVFGRFAAANELQMTNSTVYKYLKLLEKERMVVVKSNNKFSIVSVVNWCDYQDKKEKEEQQSNNKVTPKEQQSNTNKEYREYKELKNKDIKTLYSVPAEAETPNEPEDEEKFPLTEFVETCINYLNTKANTHYKPTTPKTIRLIQSRLNEGFEPTDFQRVIDVKCKKWLGDKQMQQYLRPDTLFGTKFESYLNEKVER